MRVPLVFTPRDTHLARRHIAHSLHDEYYPAAAAAAAAWSKGHDNTPDTGNYSSGPSAAGRVLKAAAGNNIPCSSPSSFTAGR